MLNELLYDDENRPIALRLLVPTKDEMELMAQINEQGPQLLQDGARTWLLMPAAQEPEFSLGSGQWIG